MNSLWKIIKKFTSCNSTKPGPTDPSQSTSTSSPNPSSDYSSSECKALVLDLQKQKEINHILYHKLQVIHQMTSRVDLPQLGAECYHYNILVSINQLTYASPQSLSDSAFPNPPNSNHHRLPEP